jgi:dTDP-4-dehydrorhamnose reductase
MNKKVLVLGAKGMLGHTLFRTAHKYYSQYELAGTIRDNDKTYFTESEQKRIISDIDVLDEEVFAKVFDKIRPYIVINCVGVIKQLKEAKDPILTIQLNALFPHKLLKLCERHNARLICISTDCVFDGLKGNYSEEDNPAPIDLYGRTKLLGEIAYSRNCITIRTSIIGHELSTKNGLLEWFLSQKEKVNGYTKAYYSGFTTLELSKIILEKIIPNENLNGIFNIASDSITKYELLKLISGTYNKNITISPYEDFYCNRVLTGAKFNKITGYKPPAWDEMIINYFNFYKNEYIPE